METALLGRLLAGPCGRNGTWRIGQQKEWGGPREMGWRGGKERQARAGVGRPRLKTGKGRKGNSFSFSNFLN